jgi:ankyrin repeat protein
MMMRIFCCLLLVAQPVFSQDVFEFCRTGKSKKLEKLLHRKPELVHITNQNGFCPLIIAAYKNQVECVQILLNNGANINQSSPEGTAIVGTCFKNNVPLTKLLLENGASPNEKGNGGYTPLIFAVQHGNKELVELLLQHNALTDLVDDTGRSAKTYADLMHFTELVEILKQHEKKP